MASRLSMTVEDLFSVPPTRYCGDAKNDARGTAQGHWWATWEHESGRRLSLWVYADAVKAVTWGKDVQTMHFHLGSEKFGLGLTWVADAWCWLQGWPLSEDS